MWICRWSTKFLPLTSLSHCCALYVIHIWDPLHSTPYCFKPSLLAYTLYRTGWMVRGSNPGRGEIFYTHPDWPWAHTVFKTVGVGLFLGLKQPRRSFDHPPHLAPRLKKEYTSAALLGLRGWTLPFIPPVRLMPVSVVCTCCGKNTKKGDAS